MRTTQLHKQRLELPKGERAEGTILAGPSNYWRVNLDEATLHWESDLIVWTGLESGITVRAPSILECREEYWEGFCDLYGLVRGGFSPAGSTRDQATEFRRAFERRFLETVRTPPSDGNATEIEVEFWDTGTTGQVNLNLVPLGSDPVF